MHSSLVDPLELGESVILTLIGDIIHKWVMSPLLSHELSLELCELWDRLEEFWESWESAGMLY